MQAEDELGMPKIAVSFYICSSKAVITTLITDRDVLVYLSQVLRVVRS